MKKKLTYITVSLQNQGHGTFPRHEKMGLSLAYQGNKVIWISPPGYKNKNFTNIDLMFNFIPNFFFFGIYLKIFLTCLFNKDLLIKIDKIFVIREYDALSMFFNPYFKNCKKIFFSRGDVISILKINLPDQNIFNKFKDKVKIFFYPYLQKIVIRNSDAVIFQAKFLKEIYEKRLNLKINKTYVLPNNCINNFKKNKKKINQKKINLGFAAPMYWSCKGLKLISEIYKEFTKQDFSFLLNIAGKGPHKKKLIKTLKNISPKNFKYHGWVKNIDSFFDKIDILIVPSLFDSCPNLIFEGLQRNKIIFANDIDSHKEILKDKELIFSKKNIQELCLKINKIYCKKKYKNKILRKIIRAKKNSSFNWQKKFCEILIKC